MSKKVKNLQTMELKQRFSELEGVAVISPRGIDAIKNHGIRSRLHAKGLRMMVVKNTLAKRATDGTKLSGFEKLLDFPYLHDVRISGRRNPFAGLTISSSEARRKERSD